MIKSVYLLHIFKIIVLVKESKNFKGATLMNVSMIDKIREKSEHKDSKWIIISLGFMNRRAHVFKLKNNNYANKKINEEIKKFSDNEYYMEWLRVDFISSEEKVRFSEIHDDLIKTRRNYVDYGISFDPDYNLAFLPEEINANAFIRPMPGKDHRTLFLCERNINTYLKKYKSYRGIYFHKKYFNKSVTKFFTQGYLIHKDEIHTLMPHGYMHGIREVSEGERKAEYHKFVKTSTNHLADQLRLDGKYEYGIFPHFDKKIGFYNVLRHASSTYSLLEGLEYLDDQSGIEGAKRALDYLLEHCLHIDPEEKDAAYIFDDTKKVNEIKLGQNGVTLVALTKYMSMTGSEEYLDAARKIARGTMRMIGEEGDTVHVLNYPELTVKEEKRVIYYDGEAAFGC